MSFWSSIHQIRCNTCSGMYYVNNGDPNDITGCDVVAAKCPWCGAIEDFRDAIEKEMIDGTAEDLAEDGMKSLPEQPPKTLIGR